MKIIFLDRDGVINREPGKELYVTSIKKFRFLPRVRKAIKLLTDANFKIFIISNQAGISKKFYSLKTLNSITKKMLIDIAKANGKIEKVYYCIHQDSDNCGCRKPKIGNIKKALSYLKKNGKINKSRIFFVGDSIRDVKTGKKAGLKTILVSTGKEKIINKDNWDTQPDFFTKDLYSAVRDIVLNSKTKL